MSDAKTFKKTPSVLAFQRGFVMSDAILANVFADGSSSDLPVIRHGIRGTQNVAKTADAKASTAGDAKRQEVSNIQETDSAKLDQNAAKMRATFTIRFVDLQHALFACAPGKDDKESFEAFRDSVTAFIQRAKSSEGIKEVANRYARNIVNGRWLWRNRLLAKAITVKVYEHGTGDNKAALATFDALKFPLNEFANYSKEEGKVAQRILEGLLGESSTGLTVEADVDFGITGAIEVFPSQNYLSDKPRGFARSLYCLGQADAVDKTLGIRVMGTAALRDQKVANAIRTIDTWYPDYVEFNRPIAIEPNGASLEAQRFFRDVGNKKASAFDIIKQLNVTDPNSPEGMFFIACLIRGGVFAGGKE